MCFASHPSAFASFGQVVKNGHFVLGENNGASFALCRDGALLTKGAWLPTSYSAVCLFVKSNGYCSVKPNSPSFKPQQKKAAGSQTSVNNLVWCCKCVNVDNKQVEMVDVVDSN